MSNREKKIFFFNFAEKVLFCASVRGKKKERIRKINVLKGLKNKSYL